MDIAKRAIEAVQKTERQLLELAGTALAAGDYKSIRVAELAKAVGELVHFPGLNGEAEEATGVPLPIAHKPGDESAGESSPRPRRSPRKGEYPKFFRQREALVKIAWSKSERAEYEHRAPRLVIDLLVGAIQKKAGKGRLFTADEVLPFVNSIDGTEVPRYQTYLCLAWLRAEGLVKQKGRQGYFVREPDGLLRKVTTCWERLSPRPTVDDGI
ncbi:MAG TPA: hypothetical protein VJZ71_09875 [Phycisphaerae bacterium]|nr:hypothetical protein [Phycisphaerae bacterium]